MKKTILATIVTALTMLATPVWAQDEIQQTCTPFYGGGVVCGAHTPVETGLATSIFFSIAAILFLGGFALFIIARRVRRVYFLD